jgi:predicted ATPase
MGGKQHEPLFRLFEAQAYLHLDRKQDCEDCLERAHRCIAETNQRFYEPGGHVGSASLFCQRGDDETAETSLWMGIHVAREQQSKSWELRAATGLSRLWRDQGRCTEARDLLAPIYGWFTEGFDTPDLKDAKALLDELA